MKQEKVMTLQMKIVDFSEWEKIGVPLLKTLTGNGTAFGVTVTAASVENELSRIGKIEEAVQACEDPYELKYVLEDILN
jgi:hypothetical protein